MNEQHENQEETPIYMSPIEYRVIGGVVMLIVVVVLTLLKGG